MKVGMLEHAAVYHLMWSNALVAATLEVLPLNHPVRIFLKPFLLGSVPVNDKARKTLVAEYGFVHHAYGFDHEDLMRVFHMCVTDDETMQLYTDFEGWLKKR